MSAKRTAPVKVTKKRGLTEFAQKYGCLFCNIPERQEIEKAWAAGMETKRILLWLIEERGYPAERVLEARTRTAVHFAQHCKDTQLLALRRTR